VTSTILGRPRGDKAEKHPRDDDDDRESDET
jgi:hypothetical protein